MKAERRALVAGLGLLLAAGAGATPRRRLAEELPPLDLEAKVPRRFGSWALDREIAPVLPAPDVQDSLDKLYNSVFSRTYVDGTGRRMMFLVAYGADQADRMTLAHLPEACYSTQGFDVLPTTTASMQLEGRGFQVARLRTRKGARVEPVTYWTTVGDYALIDEVSRRWARARYSLRGIIPDGMLVRVSSLDSDETKAFDLQASFVEQLFSGLPTPTRARLFGSVA